MKEADEVRVEIDLPHPREKVWRAITEPKLLERWLMETDFAPIAGHAFHFRAPANPGWDGVIRCEVLEVDEPNTVTFTWKALGVDTVVRWTLEPTASGTRLRITQSGFADADRRAFAGARAAWPRMAATLEEVLGEMAAA